MPPENATGPAIHRFLEGGRRFAIDPETCFCFECDEISWDVLEYYPHTPVSRIRHLLKDRHDPAEVDEVVGELEWLRATRAILRSFTREEFGKQFQVDPGLKRLSVFLSRETQQDEGKRGWFQRGGVAPTQTARELGRDAVNLLLNRSAGQKDLCIEFIEPENIHNPALIGDLCAYALKHARLAGKNLTAAVRVTGVVPTGLPKALEGHALSARLEFRDPERTMDLTKTLASNLDSLPRLARALQPSAENVTGRIIVRPNHPGFGDVARTLDEAGFNTIELDLDGAFSANPRLDPKDMLAGFRETAVYYAQRLLKHHYFRLDPLASLFYRIYDGQPVSRSDPAGTNELAVTESGAVYPSVALANVKEFQLGSLVGGTIDENARAPFDDVGAQTTGVCRRCWARNLCGGGNTAVHYALSGSIRRPNPAWCDMQRAWLASAVSAFNMLSSAGVNFTRVYGALSQSFRPSLFTLVRAAFRMSIGMRPIEEADAAMLCEWENWNEASYFLCNETGILLATRYDRQMDALHPSGIDHEMLLIRKDGSPIGLVKLRPERTPGAAQGWVYLHQPSDYEAEDTRRGFRTILKEAGGQQSIRRITVPAAEYDTALQDFLSAVGFEREGTARQGLFLHNKYHDVHLYGLCLDEL